MQIITINLPEKYLDAIQVLTSLGIYPSRSEAIRTALYGFLSRELKLNMDLNPNSFKMLMKISEDKNANSYS